MICYNCFEELNNETICPKCGYNPKDDEGKCPNGLKPGSILNGRYILGRVIGQGGFGITYLALDHKEHSRVAIKEYFPSELSDREEGVSVVPYYGERGENFRFGKESFMNEAKTLAEFRGNAHIVCVNRYFEENGTAYLVMEYVEGIGLDTYMKKHEGKLSVDDANKLLLPIMEALEWVHSKGVVHRDIAPDNILITQNNTAKLIDFGAARYSTGEKSKSLDVILKHGFAPFEQYSRHGKQGPFTDVYALSATYYYAITGKIPPDSIDRIDGDQIILPSEFNTTVYPEIQDALLKGLRPAAADRYQSMAEMKSAFDNAVVVENNRREKAEKERIAAEKAAEEKRLAEEKKRLAAEKAAEEKRLAAEKAAEEKRMAAEKAAENRRLAAEKRAEKKRITEEKRRLRTEQKTETAAEKNETEENSTADQHDGGKGRLKDKRRIATIAGITLAAVVAVSAVVAISTKKEDVKEPVEEVVKITSVESAVADNSRDGVIEFLDEKAILHKNGLSVMASLLTESTIPDSFDVNCSDKEDDVCFAMNITDGVNTYRIASTHTNTQSGEKDSIAPAALTNGIYWIDETTGVLVELDDAELSASFVVNACIWEFDIPDSMILNWNNVKIADYTMAYNDVCEKIGDLKNTEKKATDDSVITIRKDNVAELKKDGGNIAVTLHVEQDLPDEFDINRDDTHLNGCEVQFAVQFSDGTNSYEISSTRWKHDNSESTKIPGSSLQHSLWTIKDAGGGSVVQSVTVDAEFGKNSIIWSFEFPSDLALDWQKVEIKNVYVNYVSDGTAVSYSLK